MIVVVNCTNLIINLNDYEISRYQKNLCKEALEENHYYFKDGHWWNKYGVKCHSDALTTCKIDEVDYHVLSPVNFYISSTAVYTAIKNKLGNDTGLFNINGHPVIVTYSDITEDEIMEVYNNE